MSVLDFCRLTTIWEDPKELDAGRLLADIFAGRRWYVVLIWMLLLEPISRIRS